MSCNGDVVSLSYKHIKKECPLCNNSNAYFDDFKFEYICSSCGCVIEDNLADISSKQFEVYTNIGKKKQYKSIGRFHGDKGKWNKTQYKRYIQVINNNISLSTYHKNRLSYLIDHIKDFRPLCGNNHDPININQIITSIALLLLKLDSNDIRIDDNEFCESLSLDNDKFHRIIYKLQGKYSYMLTKSEREYTEV